VASVVLSVLQKLTPAEPPELLLSFGPHGSVVRALFGKDNQLGGGAPVLAHGDQVTLECERVEIETGKFTSVRKCGPLLTSIKEHQGT